MPSRPRVLVAVEPRVLGDVLIAVLEALELDEVVSDGNGHRIDVAIVSADAGKPVVDLVIQLPAATEDVGWVHVGGGSDPVALRSTNDLLALLDDCAAAVESRIDRAKALASAAGGR